jgi:16S rRNA (uracil1498-N3)-methyltransferase
VSPVKGDRTDFVVEKLVEVGVDHIVLLAPVERSVVRWAANKVDHVMERYSRIARAAAMQSRRVFLPTVSGPTPLASLAHAGAAVAEPGGTADWGDVTTMIIGPEGGFTASEIAGIPSAVHLGPTILRAETAAIVGAARMVAHWRR